MKNKHKKPDRVWRIAKYLMAAVLVILGAVGGGCMVRGGADYDSKGVSE